MKQKPNSILHPQSALILLWLLFTVSIPLYATSGKLMHDVDSLGDIWIFTIDKSGSMLENKTANLYHATYITPHEVARQVMDSLSKSGLLDCIDYSIDQISIFETGYGKRKQDSYGNAFNAAAPLITTFMHAIHTSRYPFLSKYRNKRNLYNRLRDQIQNSPFGYQESFVSQIRVLALAREIDYIHEHQLNDKFRQIHIVTITDDADDNDQWLKDYYVIKQRSLKKHNELNELQSKFLYNRLSQSGGGYLEEDTLYSMAHPMQKFKIHVYHYLTLQQICDSAHFRQNSFIHCSPLDGSQITLSSRKKSYMGDPIRFIYVDEMVINGKHYPIHAYVQSRENIPFPYTYKQLHNTIQIKGQIQVRYTDRIYGEHDRKIPFEQSFGVTSTATHRSYSFFLFVFGGALLLFLIWLFLVLPYQRLMNVYLPSRKSFEVRRGYSFRWAKMVNPLAYIVNTTKNNECRDLIAKHRCISPLTPMEKTENGMNYLLIDSSKPLTVSQKLMEIDTTMEISQFIQRDPNCPDMLKTIYSTLILRLIDKGTNHRIRYIRRLCIHIRKLYNWISPHYFYWIKIPKLKDSLVLRHGDLMLRPMILEYREIYDIGSMDTTSKMLCQYYNQPQQHNADVLIGIHKLPSKWEWFVIQLNANNNIGCGISHAKKFLYYATQVCDPSTYAAATKRLKQAIEQELKLHKIAIMELTELDNNCNMPFYIEDNIFAKYIYLVEDTEEKKSIRIYSPFTDKLDSTNASKMIMLPARKRDMEIHTSMIPFSSAKDLLGCGVTQCCSRDKYLSGSAAQGTLKAQKNAISILNMTINLN